MLPLLVVTIAAAVSLPVSHISSHAGHLHSNTSAIQAEGHAMSHAQGTKPSIFPTKPGPNAAEYLGATAPSSRGRFIVNCQPTVRDNIDPIVLPGTYGVSHTHEFYGPKSIVQEPTVSGLVDSRSETSCSTVRDRSVYWHPLLYKNGKAVNPNRIQAYYTVNNLTRPAPPGLNIIVGLPWLEETNVENVRWICGGGGNDRVYQAAQDCGPGQYLMAAVSFPGCWDGKHLTSVNYFSHLAYADEQGRCPESRPRHIPQLDLFIQWDCSATCTPNRLNGEEHFAKNSYVLSSGNTGGFHADVIFNWDPRVQRYLINRCEDRDCGLLGKDQPVVPQRPAS